MVCYGFELQSVRDARPLPKGITHIFQVLPRWLQSIGLKRWCAHPGIYGQLCSRIASEYEEHLERIGEREPASQWPGLHDTYAEWRGER
ncbi:MAG: hypothetical protein PHG85_07460 [Candidatus Altiarchaeota archaeon]|nr:hypothetical protein [Candidatus Altiarchaeota archaeon]